MNYYLHVVSFVASVLAKDVSIWIFPLWFIQHETTATIFSNLQRPQYFDTICPSEPGLNDWTKRLPMFRYRLKFL